MQASIKIIFSYLVNKSKSNLKWVIKKSKPVLLTNTFSSSKQDINAFITNELLFG